ncbi:30S ribosomal protein S3 [Candidatus Vidania fulgoroideorum]
MGNKINPICYRSKLRNIWINKYYSKNYFREINLINKLKIYLSNFCDYLDKLEIEIINSNLIINIYSLNPGLIIGKNGENILKIKNYIIKKFKFYSYIDIKEYTGIDKDFNYLFFNIINKIKFRENYKYFLKKSFNILFKKNIIGIKVIISGRLNGSDLSKIECVNRGRVPLQTYNNNIFFNKKYINTKFGLVGIKIWINYDI